MTERVIERVARAICAADPLAPEPDAPIYIGVKAAKAWQARAAMARAAVEAMREPSPEMIRACHDGVAGSLRDVAGWYRNFWRAGIDAILAEQE